MHDNFLVFSQHYTHIYIFDSCVKSIKVSKKLKMLVAHFADEGFKMQLEQDFTDI